MAYRRACLASLRGEHRGKATMGFISRSTGEPVPFWRTKPVRTADPAELYQHGIRCSYTGDGQGAIATGWAIWELAGLHELQAWDFLTDGYRDWRSSGAFDRALAQQFLVELLQRLGAPPRAPGPNLYAVPREAVEPVAAVHSAICWAASEVLEVVDAPERDAWLQRAVTAIASTRRDFVPPRSMQFAIDYASARALSPPVAVSPH